MSAIKARFSGWRRASKYEEARRRAVEQRLASLRDWARDNQEYVRALTSVGFTQDSWDYIQIRNEKQAHRRQMLAEYRLEQLFGRRNYEETAYPLARLKAAELRIGKPELPDVEPAPPLVLVLPGEGE